MVASEEDRAAAAGEAMLTILCCLFGAAVLLGAGYGIWDNVPVNLHVIALFASLFCYVSAFSLIVLGFTRSRYATKAVVAGVAFAFLAYAGSSVLFKVPAYDSDAMLFNSYSAQLLLSGTDPYTQTMQPGYRLFGVAEGVTTPTLNGGEVYALSYPALSFLVYVPFLALGLTNLLWVSVAAHLLIMLMLVRIAPRPFRALAPFVLFLDPTYFDYTVGGITDVLWIPAGMLTALYWRRNPVAAAVWLGIACAFKQTPWVIVPFALIHWVAAARASRRIRDVLLPAAASLVAFAVPNVPFAIWHPAAWLAGVTTPLSAHLVVLGTGFAQLATSGLVSVPESTFTAMTLVTFAVVLGLYVVFPRRLAFLPFLAPALIFFFASRSLHNYFMYWPIVLITYLFANWKEDYEDYLAAKEPLTRPKAVGLAVLCAAVLIPLAARPAAATMQVKILGGSRSAVTGRVDTLHILVTNPVKNKAFVHFDVAEQGVEVDIQAWKPRVLEEIAPGETRSYTIVAPSNELQLQSDGSTSTQVLAIDTSGRESYSAPVIFSGRTPKIHNPNFAYWSNGSPPFPVAWQFYTSDWVGGRIAKAEVAGEDAVAFRVGPPVHGVYRPTVLEQITDARSGTLAFRLYPATDYSGTGQRTNLFGIELRDVVGHRVYCTIDSRRRTPVMYRSGRGAFVFVEPGRVGAWNTITIDLTALQAQTDFVLAPSATMVVGAFASGYDPSMRMAGYFGGIRSLDTRSPSDMTFVPDGAAMRAPTAPHASGLTRSSVPSPPSLASAGGGARFERMTYDGRWQGNRVRSGDRYRATEMETSAPGASASLEFHGAGVRIYGATGPAGGRALVVLDGKRQTVDLYTARKAARVVIFRAAELDGGEHHLRIAVEPADWGDPERASLTIDSVEVDRLGKQHFVQQPISAPPGRTR